MARQLWLLRHADAEPHGTRPDAERRLTARGERQAKVLGAAISRLGVQFEAALVSPKVRARRTAELAAESFSEQQRSLLRVHPPLSAGFEAVQALDVMAGLSADGRALVVGHEPDLSGVASALTGARLDLKKGGLAVLRLEGGSAELVLLMRPRELALISGEPGLDV